MISSGILTRPSPLRKNKNCSVTKNVQVVALLGIAVLAGCSSTGGPKSASESAVSHAASVSRTANPLPGMPPVLDPDDIYSADRPNALADVVKDFPARVYVP